MDIKVIRITPKPPPPEFEVTLKLVDEERRLLIDLLVIGQRYHGSDSHFVVADTILRRLRTAVDL